MADSPTSTDGRTDRAQRIADAAVKVFAARGYHDTRVQDIADEAGVAYGLVYHYFGTKEKLLGAIFDANWAIFADVVEGIVGSSRGPEDQLRAVLDYVFGALDAYPDRMKAIFLEYGRLTQLGDALGHAHVTRVLGGLERTCVLAAERGRLRPGVDPRAVPVLLLGALQAAIVASFVAGPGADRPSPDAVRATVLALFRGVLVPPPS